MGKRETGAFERPAVPVAAVVKPVPGSGGEDMRPPSQWRAEVVGRLAEWLTERIERAGPLPGPCPGGPQTTAEWWLGQQEPRRVRGPGYESVDDYAARVRSALAGWLRLRPIERRAVLAGVAEDGVPYRGDSWEMYKAICEETMATDVGVEGRRERALAALARLRGRLLGRAGPVERAVPTGPVEVAPESRSLAGVDAALRESVRTDPVGGVPMGRGEYGR